MQPPESNTVVNPAGQPGRAGRPVRHQFSRPFARAHGITAAIIAGYLAHRIAATRKRLGEGYRCSINELKSHYSYLSRTAIADALKSLSPGVLTVVTAKNWHASDHTRHYAFATSALLRSASEAPIYFNIAEAEQYGMPCALLLTNLRMRIADERAHQRGSDTYRVSARGLTKHLPLTRSTISRALQHLAKTGVRMHRCKGFDRAYEVEVDSVLPLHDAPADSCGSKPDSCDPVPDVHAPNPDVYRTLKGDITKSSLESSTSYEGRPAAPTAERASFESSAARPDGEPVSRACGVTAGQATGVGLPNQDSATEGNAGSVTEAASLAPRLELLDEDNPFAGFKPFTPSTRQPVPTSLEELRCTNSGFWRCRTVDRESILGYVDVKVDAVIRQQGVGTVFRWLAIHDDDKLFAVIREAVERCRCPKADLTQFDWHVGVDWFCSEWLVDACRQYLDDSARWSGHQGSNTVLNILTDCLPVYYRRNKAVLEAEGLAHLRYGKDVRAERCKSPDVELEKAEHISAAEKTRVFRNAILSINLMGRWNGDGRLLHDLIVFTEGSFKLVRRFFETNPHWTVAPLLGVLQMCIHRVYYTKDPGGYLSDYAVTQGTHLTYFMRHFERILTELSHHAFVPAVSFPDGWAKKEAA